MLVVDQAARLLGGAPPVGGPQHDLAVDGCGGQRGAVGRPAQVHDVALAAVALERGSPPPRGLALILFQVAALHAGRRRVDWLPQQHLAAVAAAGQLGAWGGAAG